jgi:hypothetical protein
MASSGINLDVGGVTTGLTALAGGAAPTASANTLSSGINVVSTVATAGDSMILPAGIPQYGKVSVYNTSAATLDIFPNTGGTINGGAANSEKGLATLTGATFVQVGVTGLTWVADNLIAKQS